MIKLLSLFSGIGAFEKALERQGIEYQLVNYCEIDKYASKAYSLIHNVSEQMNLGDITKIDTFELDDDIDIITHGSPCFLAGEIVNTIDGFKNIEDLKIGDIVLSHDGTYNKVIRTMKNKNDMIYDIKCGCSHMINTTFNHPFYVSRDGVKQWIEAKDLTDKDYMLVPVNTKQEDIKWEGVELNYNRHYELVNNLPFEDSRFWYLIGRFIGDGWVCRRKDRNNNISGIKVCCAKNELEDLKEKLGDVLKYCVIEERTVYKLQFCNKELGEFCSQFGIGAENKNIPKNILNLKNKYLYPLLQGILDSDGSYNGTRYKVTSVSKKLVYNIGELVLKLYRTPYHVSKTNRPKNCCIEGRIVNQKDTYTVYWNDGNITESVNYVDENYLYSRIRKIECREELNDVYNIEVENTHSYCVNNIATHNCQDFSVAGKQAGGDEGSNTRSSLMWNTVDIVKHVRPKVVLWENVKNLLGKKHRHNFDSYIEIMDELGYNSYYQVLNAKDYGIPQNRERVYTISIRKDIDNGEFKFPEPFELKLRLKDMLENTVEEKYYLSDQFLKGLEKHNENHHKKGTGFIWKPKIGDETANCLRANAALCPTDNTIIVASRGRYDENGNIEQHIEPNDKGLCNTLTTVLKDNLVCEPKLIQVGQIYGTEREPNPQAGRVYDANGLSPTMDSCSGGNRMPKVIVEEKLTGAYGRNFGSKGKLQDVEGSCDTLLSAMGCGGGNVPIVKEQEIDAVNPMSDGTCRTIKHQYANTSIANTVRTGSMGATMVSERLPYQTEQNESKQVYNVEDKHVNFVGRDGNERNYPVNLKDGSYRIRKLTPRECFRLMGFDDSDFDKVEGNLSNSQLYKMAGNSIVVNVLEEIYKQLFKAIKL